MRKFSLFLKDGRVLTSGYTAFLRSGNDLGFSFPIKDGDISIWQNLEQVQVVSIQDETSILSIFYNTFLKSIETRKISESVTHISLDFKIRLN